MHFLFLEPFDGGSHGAFLRVLTSGLSEQHGVRVTVLALPGRHWKWRMRGAVPYWAERYDAELRGDYDLVFASSFVSLAELVGLYPHLAATSRVLYFHENQLTYPVRREFVGERDHHFGFTQMMSSLAATECWFNSAFNMTSFLDAGAELLRRMPDARPAEWASQVGARSHVFGVPLDLPDQPSMGGGARQIPRLLWNHRMEHDKGPEECFGVLAKLAAEGLPFELIVCGEAPEKLPPHVATARDALGDRILHWGFCEDRADYWRWLGKADFAMSTARHEFFGVGMLEAAWMGACPIVPDRLAYAELFDVDYRFADFEPALRARLTAFAAGRRPSRTEVSAIAKPFRAATLVREYYERLAQMVGEC